MTQTTKLPDSGEIVVVDFPGVTGTKRRPAVVLSSPTYHAARPDVILGIITTQVASSDTVTDYTLHDWKAAGLRKPSAFRAFLVTVPRLSDYLIRWQTLENRLARSSRTSPDCSGAAIENVLTALPHA
jgi:mRNA interferase MazF